MAGKGPPKTPTLTLTARGSWRAKLPERAAEPGKFEIPSSECPKCLNGDARVMWDAAIKPLFAHPGLMTILDVQAAILLCQAWGIVQQARAEFCDVGVVVRTKEGKQQHPAFRAMMTAADLFNRLAGQFGIMPANRSRLTQALQNRNMNTQDKAKYFQSG